jgi:trimeric autotransporter adhesin
MRHSVSLLFLAALGCAAVFGQTADYPYIVKTFAGSWIHGDGGPATSGLLYFPNAVVPDGNGNLYILDAGNYRIRKVGADRKISTFVDLPVYGYDLKRGDDGYLYVSGESQVIKISPSGTVSVVAGTGEYGYGGDGGPATSALVGDAYGVAVDNAGTVYFSDVSTGSHRIRQVTTDGIVQTIAGAGAPGFNGDNQAARAAALYDPSGLAVDSTGNIYVADYNNYRIRKFKVGGTITTIAGATTWGQPVNGPAVGNRLGQIEGLWVDAGGTVYATDTYNDVVFKVSAGGALTLLAGNFDAYSHPEDGPSLSVSVRNPVGVGVDDAGIVWIADATHRIRQMSANGGNLTTVAGRIHFAGDGGPATSALLNEPLDITFDPQGNAYIADSLNYVIRKVTPDGRISTFAGKLRPGALTTGTSIDNAMLPYVEIEATDAAGAIYFASSVQVFKVTPDGVITLVAGTGSAGNTGDGGKATLATFTHIDGIAVGAGGTLYIADLGANRVRAIAPDTGIISAFAGSGTRGRAGDGQLATGAQFRFVNRARVATDSSGNVYLTDDGNYQVRMVDRQGIITNVVGNGTRGHVEGVRATSAGFSVPCALAVDPAGDLYVATDGDPEIYRVSGGMLRRISGSGSEVAAEGLPALRSFFYTVNLRADANRDLYSVDMYTSTVRKLVWNAPAAFSVLDGDRQTAAIGESLAKPLKVQVMGRAGVGVAAVTVNFTVTSGSARLSSATALTDTEGIAGVALTVGPSAGPVTVTATVGGTTLGPVTFTATGTGAPVTCSLPQPSIASVRSAGDFGGSATFASGSWLEIKGSNLSASTRSWGGDDFTGPNAPTSLDGVTVTINGKRAFVGYISPGQINVQAPGDSTTGSVDVAVATSSCSTATVKAEKAATAGGLLAPGAFNIGGQQYAAALFADGFYVGATGLIPGVPFRPAKPGDNITLYGIGFGDVTPAITPGVVVSSASSVPGLTIAFGTTSATVGYAGLAPDAVGLYQFNVVVPDVPDGDHRVVVKIGGTAISQTAYLTVKR